MAGYEGFQALGDAIVGGPGQRAEQQYPVRLKQNFDAFQSLEEARIKRAQAMAREALPSAVRSSGIQHPDLATAILGMASGQPNLGTYTSGLQDLGDIELQRQQVEAAKSGNVDQVNLLNAVAADKLMERTKITGGVAYDPYAAPDATVMLPTPVGAADIDYKSNLGDAAMMRAGAAAAEDVEHARVYSAQAAQGGFRPTAPKITTEAQTQAKIDYILAEGTRLAKDRGNEWADAWVNKELAKAGLDLQPVTDATELGNAIRVPATKAWSEAEVQKAINDARRAIASGRITKEAARKRLLDAGLANAAKVL